MSNGLVDSVLDYLTTFGSKKTESRLRDPFADRTRSIADIEEEIGNNARGIDDLFRIGDVYTACGIYGNGVASMDFMTFIDNEEEDVELPNHWLTRLFTDKVNDYMSPSDFKITCMYHWGITGNACALITRNRRGEVISLDLLDPYKLDKAYVTKDGRKFWKYTHIQKPIPDEKIFHISGPSLNGIIGANPIEAHRELFNSSNYMYQYREKFFENGAALKHVIETDSILTQNERNNFVSSWHRLFAGPLNAGKTAVLENGMRLKPLQISPLDAGYLEMSSDTQRAIANIYRLPLFLFNSYKDGAQYDNIESQNLFFVNYSMAPMAKKWEEEIKRKLVPPKSRIRGRFDLFSLARGDMKSIADYAKNFFVLGALNQDEIRKKYLKMNPLPNNLGTKYYVQGNNMVPIDKIDEIYQQKQASMTAAANQTGFPDTKEADLPSLKEDQ